MSDLKVVIFGVFQTVVEYRFFSFKFGFLSVQLTNFAGINVEKFFTEILKIY